MVKRYSETPASEFFQRRYCSKDEAHAEYTTWAALNFNTFTLDSMDMFCPVINAMCNPKCICLDMGSVRQVKRGVGETYWINRVNWPSCSHRDIRGED